MQINVSGKRLDTAPIERLITQGEKNADSIEIVLPVMYGDIDLTALSWALAGVSDKETRVEQQLTKSVDGGSLTLTWTITEKWAAVSGCLLLELSGFNQDSTTVIKFTGKPIEVQTSAELFGLPAPDLAAEYLETMREIAAEARQAAEAIAQAGLKIIDYYPTLALLQTAVVSPKIADMYGVGVSPGIFAYVWNGTAWVKGHQLDPAVSSVNGQTGNVVLTATDMTAAFSRASTKANIATGEKLSVIFGKLMKWFTDFGTAAWMNTGTTSSTVALGNHTHTAAAVGAVPTTRKVNGKALSADVTLTAPDVGARAGDWLPTLLDVGGVNENLIHNGDFGESVINQRSFAEETTSGKYTVDGWKLELNIGGAGSVVYDNTNKCLVLKRTGAGKTSLVKWLFEIPLAESTNITITLKLQDGSTYVRTIMPTDSNQTIDLDVSKSLRVYISRQYFSVVNYSPTIENADIAVKWVKLEYGTSSTPNYPPLNPQQKLARCQRYLQHLHRYCFFVGAVLDANIIDFIVPLPVSMRVSPIMLNAGGITINGVSGFTVTPAVTYNNDSYVRCRAVKTNHGVAPATTIFASVDADNVFLSAEL